jgi:hypothetical protein
MQRRQLDLVAVAGSQTKVVARVWQRTKNQPCGVAQERGRRSPQHGLGHGWAGAAARTCLVGARLPTASAASSCATWQGVGLGAWPAGGAGAPIFLGDDLSGSGGR